MKKIINWTFGSFFRSLGRILSYLLIGGALAYIGAKLNLFSILKLDAATKPQLILNYDAEFISKNHKSQFFGENGYLERVRKVLTSGNVNLSYYAIYFSKNDLCVESYINEFTYWSNHGYAGKRHRNLSISYNYYYLDGKFYVTNLVSKNSKKLCLSKFNDIDLFINSLVNFDSLATNFTQNVNVINSVDVSIEKLNTNFDYFDLGFTDYYIPYYANLDSYHYVDNIFFNVDFDQKDNFSNYTSITNYYYTNFSNSLPYYYNKKGYEEPATQVGGFVYNTALIIDSKNINNAATSFEFKTETEPIISSIEYYAVVNDNGLKHYEKLSDDKITNFTYTTSYSNKKFSFSFDINSFVYTDYVYDTYLTKYENIYIKINYTNSFKILKDTFKYTLGAYTNQLINNDICSQCMFLQLDSSGQNTYLFSNSDSSKDTFFYYTQVPKNDFFYNEPSFLNLTNKNVINSAISVNKFTSYYGTFNNLIFNNYTLGGNTGLIMNIYFLGAYDLANGTIVNHNGASWSGSFQILYFITPNIYWSDSVYTLVRDSFTGKSIDEDGNVTEITIKGDFVNRTSDNISISNNFDILAGIISDDFYGLSGILLTPLNFIKNLSTKSCQPLSLPIPFTNKNISLPCFSTIYSTYVNELLIIWHTVLYGIVVYSIAVDIFKTVKNTLDSDKNNLEVLDL